jgi:hypothetical protein
MACHPEIRIEMISTTSVNQIIDALIIRHPIVGAIGLIGLFTAFGFVERHLDNHVAGREGARGVITISWLLAAGMAIALALKICV